MTKQQGSVILTDVPNITSMIYQERTIITEYLNITTAVVLVDKDPIYSFPIVITSVNHQGTKIDQDRPTDLIHSY
jgi:hypothetical protein